MNLFYTPGISEGLYNLDEDESRHCRSVLRLSAGDTLFLTDGRGTLFEARIIDTKSRSVVVETFRRHDNYGKKDYYLHLAVAPTKNIDRFEWFLEKATEIGIDEITPLLCKRSERDTVRLDRLEKILVSAMKQSLRARLPRLNPMTPVKKVLENAVEAQKCIAWCAPEPLPHLKNTLRGELDTLVLIGPEGDFTPEEVALALEKGFTGVSLGSARLRTETAGLLAVAAVNLKD